MSEIQVRHNDGEDLIPVTDSEPLPVRDDGLISSQVAGTWTTTQVSVLTTATKVASVNQGRKAIAITQITGSQIVYLGPTNGVSASNSQFLGPTAGNTYTSSYKGEIWGIAATGAQTVSISEESF